MPLVFIGDCVMADNSKYILINYQLNNHNYYIWQKRKMYLM